MTVSFLALRWVTQSLIVQGIQHLLQVTHAGLRQSRPGPGNRLSDPLWICLKGRSTGRLFFACDIMKISHDRIIDCIHCIVADSRHLGIQPAGA